MPNVSIVIPVGPGHSTIAQKAIASAQAQTIEADVLTVYDSAGNGPGWARNRGLDAVTTPYVVFLDADDTLDRTFVEKTLQAIRPNRYVYTDWHEPTGPKQAPSKPWCYQTWHPVTTLLPTALARNVNGFDESLPGSEDTDFYLKIVTLRRCGIYVPEALVHYTDSGQSRSKTFKAGPHYKATMDEITRRYTGQMGCCADYEIDMLPLGEKQPGDVLAAAIWGGNRRQIGTETGRHYPRTGNNKQVWVARRDAEARPDLWRVIEEPAVDDVPMLEGVADIAAAFIGAWSEPADVRRERKPEANQPMPALKAAPDVAGLVQRARKALDGE